MPPTIPWHTAPDELPRLLAIRGGRIIGITGPVGAGKSTLAARLSSCIVSTDHYLPNYDDIPYERRDEPDAADLPRLVRDLASLAAGLPTTIPLWSFQTHRREGETLIHPPAADAPIVCEGLHALHEPVASALHLRVFVDAPADIRWARWEHLEVTGARGWGPKVAREFFDAVAEPTFNRWLHTLRAAADVIVTNEEGVPG